MSAGWYEVSTKVELSLSLFFGSLGRHVARRPVLVFVACLVVSIACGAGFMFKTSKSAIEDLWVPADSPAKHNYDFGASW